MLNKILHNRPPLVLLFLVVLQSCSVIPFLNPASLDKARELAANNYYKGALVMVEKQLGTPLEEPRRLQWQALQNEISGQSEQFVQSEFALIDSLLGEDNWPAANEKIDFLRQHAPLNDQLNRHLETFTARQTRYLGRLQSSLLLLKSRHIPEELVLQSQLHQAEPHNSVLHKQLRRSEADRERVLAALSEQFLQAEAEQQFDTALLYARAIQRLAPSLDIDNSIARIQALLAPIAIAKSNSLNSELDEQYQQQLNEFGKALVNDQWLQARAVLDKMLEERPRDSELLGQDTYLKEIFTEQVAQAKESGEQLYSTGEVEQALEVWQAVLPMVPNDVQLKANIERARRILDKVKSLREDSLAGEPPQQPELQEQVDGNAG